MSIEWTDVGKAYMATCTHMSKREVELRRAVSYIRVRHGYPHWEIKKAVYNAEGDVQRALEQLQEDREP